MYTPLGEFTDFISHELQDTFKIHNIITCIQFKPWLMVTRRVFCVVAALKENMHQHSTYQLMNIMY